MKKHELFLVVGMLLAAFVAGSGSFWLGKMVGSVSSDLVVYADQGIQNVWLPKGWTFVQIIDRHTSFRMGYGDEVTVILRSKTESSRLAAWQAHEDGWRPVRFFLEH